MKDHFDSFFIEFYFSELLSSDYGKG